MRLTALNGSPEADAPWRGAMVVRGRTAGPGVLLDPTGTVSSRLVADDGLRQACGLDGATLPVLLTRAQLDQIAALIELRHGSPIDLYTTPALFDSLSSSAAIWPAPQASCTMHWRMVPLGGDRLQAHFQVEQQRGVGYTALLCCTDDGENAAPVALLARSEGTGAQMAWVRGSGLAHEGLDALLAAHWPDIRWLALDLGEEAPSDALPWLLAAPVPHKLLLGGGAAVRASAEAAGIVVARDGLEIEVA